MDEREKSEIACSLTGKTKRLGAEFSKYLTSKLNDAKINCSLSSINNYFTSKQIFWRGFYRCTHRDCDLKYNAEITDFETGIVNLSANGVCEHDSNTKRLRCSGPSRAEMQMKLLAFGTLNVQAENVIHNEFNKETLGKLFFTFTSYTECKNIDYFSIKDLRSSQQI